MASKKELAFIADRIAQVVLDYNLPEEAASILNGEIDALVKLSNPQPAQESDRTTLGGQE